MLGRYATVLLPDVSQVDDNEQLENGKKNSTKKRKRRKPKIHTELPWLEIQQHFQMDSIVGKITKANRNGFIT